MLEGVWELSEFEIKECSFTGASIEVDGIEIEDEKVREYVEENFDPDDIFGDEELQEWAKNNGFIKKGD
jgi:hypothetical protein